MRARPVSRSPMPSASITATRACRRSRPISTSAFCASRPTRRHGHARSDAVQAGRPRPVPARRLQSRQEHRRSPSAAAQPPARVRARIRAPRLRGDRAEPPGLCGLRRHLSAGRLQRRAKRPRTGRRRRRHDPLHVAAVVRRRIAHRRGGHVARRPRVRRIRHRSGARRARHHQLLRRAAPGSLRRLAEEPRRRIRPVRRAHGRALALAVRRQRFGVDARARVANARCIRGARRSADSDFGEGTHGTAGHQTGTPSRSTISRCASFL
ncbi:hypothetical protein FEP09_01473 [Burkholderia multivorans]|nr:hypothetical protein [Burkholderia multivorans]